jgi:hypothetical protein
LPAGAAVLDDEVVGLTVALDEVVLDEEPQAAAEMAATRRAAAIADHRNAALPIRQL